MDTAIVEVWEPELDLVESSSPYEQKYGEILAEGQAPVVMDSEQAEVVWQEIRTQLKMSAALMWKIGRGLHELKEFFLRSGRSNEEFWEEATQKTGYRDCKTLLKVFERFEFDEVLLLQDAKIGLTAIRKLATTDSHEARQEALQIVRDGEAHLLTPENTSEIIGVCKGGIDYDAEQPLTGNEEKEPALPLPAVSSLSSLSEAANSEAANSEVEVASKLNELLSLLRYWKGRYKADSPRGIGLHSCIDEAEPILLSVMAGLNIEVDDDGDEAEEEE